MSKFKANKLHRHTDRSDRLAWLLIGVILAFTAVVRLRLLQIPLERDEGEFAYMGQLILQGIPPYKLAFNMKFPGIYYAYALLMAVFGRNIAGVHLGFLVVNCTAIVLVFLLGRRLCGRSAGVTAAAGYAVLSISPTVLGTSAHATHFVLLLALGGILLLLKSLEKDSKWLLLMSGFLLGTGVLMKQPGVLFVLFALFYLAAVKLGRKRTYLKETAVSIAVLSTGALIPCAITFGVLLLQGVFDRFWFWAFVYGREYAAAVPVSKASGAALAAASRVIGACATLWIGAAIGLGLIFVDKSTTGRRLFLVFFTVFSLLAVCPGFYFREHYFVLALPAVALLAGAAAGSCRHILSKKRGCDLFLATLVIVMIGYPIVSNAGFLFAKTPIELCRSMYSLNPFPESIEVAKYVKANTQKNDTIAVLGSEPQIYFYSGRHSATGHIYMYGLMEGHDYALKMQRELVSQVESARPKIIIVVGTPQSWLYTDRSNSYVLDWSRTYLKKHYSLVGTVAIMDEETTVYLWGDDAKRYRGGQSTIYVFKRNRLSGG